MTQEPMQAVSLEALLAKRATTDSGFPEDWVEIPDIGAVHVRGLSRKEVLAIQKVAKGAAQVEQITVSRGMLAPRLTDDQVAEWQAVSVAGELDKVTKKIGELSAMLPGSAKKAYMDFEADPGAEFRSLPGGEAVDDGGLDAHGTEPAAQ